MRNNGQPRWKNTDEVNEVEKAAQELDLSGIDSKTEQVLDGED